MGPTWGPPGSCRPQMGPMLAPWNCYQGLIWSESTRWFLSFGIRKSLGARITLMHTAMWDGWANDYHVTHLQNKTVKNVIWSGSAQWLLSSSDPKIPGVLIIPEGTPMWPRWANNFAYLQVKTIPMNLTWSESAQCMLSYGVRKYPRALITTWARPCGPDGQITITLHIYRQIRFQWNRLEVDPSSDWRPKKSRRPYCAHVATMGE